MDPSVPESPATLSGDASGEQVFRQALEAMGPGDGLLPPRQFLAFARDCGVELRHQTQKFISIDSFRRLPRVLREADAMVLRLGGEGVRTDFTLVRIAGGLRSFFFFDHEVLDRAEAETFLPVASVHQLYAFGVLNAGSEANLVNFAFASGLLAEALELDEPGPLFPPATGASRYTFAFRPHSGLDATITHRAGQVEVDALFVARRGGRQCLFVMEAKADGDASLAKHKLLYPTLALADRVPRDMPVIPVYVRLHLSVAGLDCMVAECDAADRSRRAALDEFTVRKASRLLIPPGVAGFGASPNRGARA